MIFDIGQWHINIFVILYVDVEEEELRTTTTTTTPTQHTIDLLFRPYRYLWRTTLHIQIRSDYKCGGKFLEI